MGHGTFSTAAKYPPPLPLALVLSHVGLGGLTFQDPGLYPEATHFCHPLTPILLGLGTDGSGQHSVSIANISEEPCAAKEIDLTVTPIHLCLFIYYPSLS